MSFDPIGDTIKVGQQATQQAGDHLLNTIDQQAPATFAAIAKAIVDVLATGGYELVIALRKRQ